MSGRIVTILYEDQSSAAPNDFGPHALLLAMLADDLGRSRWQLRNRFNAIPKNGNSKLRTELKLHTADMAAFGPVFAVLDGDRVRECYGLPRDSCLGNVVTAIKEEASGPVEVVIVDRNMESVVRVCRKEVGRDPNVPKPTPRQRDRDFHGAADAAPDVRAGIRKGSPTFDRLAKKVLLHVR